MLARVIEEAGLPTTAIALIREHAARVKPPRALFVPFPLGFALGKPNDPAFQHKVLTAAFDLFGANSGPVLAEFPEESDAPIRLLHASDIASAAGARTRAPGDPANELTMLRGYYERWLAEHDSRTGVGLTGVPQRRWRGLVRYLEAFADGRDVEYAERPPDLSIARFIRFASDDLKAFYFEARMSQRPDQRDNDLHRWLWAETALGRLLSRVADRMSASDEPDWIYHGKHIAR